jgi:glutathione synthase/RimK-type ligase-like ATP-grasp enzyme
MAILFVSGINDQSRIGATLDENNSLTYLLDGNCSIHRQIPLKAGIDSYVVLFGKGVQQRRFDFTLRPSLIFNQIADVDTHRSALERCVELCSQVNSPVINHPEKILQTSRDHVSELLQGIPGVTMPRTVRFNPESPDDVFERAESENFSMPFIVRVAGDHGGKSMTRVNSREDYKALHVYPFDGRDFYLTEYADCKDSVGHYHRQRLVVIDGEPVLRGSLYDKDWKVHGASRLYMMKRETWEDDQVRSKWLEAEVIPELGTAIREITKRLNLEFYGIDCSLEPGGRMLIFEANANMNILTNDHPQMNERMDMIKRKIHTMLARHSGEEVI